VIEAELVVPAMEAAERGALGVAGWISAAQNGLVRLYAFATVLAVAAVVIAVLWLEA